MCVVISRSTLDFLSPRLLTLHLLIGLCLDCLLMNDLALFVKESLFWRITLIVMGVDTCDLASVDVRGENQQGNFWLMAA